MLSFDTPDGSLDVTLHRLVVAGWTGRNIDAVNHHIEELAEIGVPRPSTVPLYYEVSPGLATQAETIAVLGEETSGEVEPFLLRAGGRLWLGVASDHTDRWLEATSVAHSKQGCPKVIGRGLWPFDDLRDRLDGIALRTRIPDGELYQDGTFAQIRPLESLLEANPLADGEAMLCGTVPAIGGVRPAPSYDMEIVDDALGSLTLSYAVKILPVVS